MRRVLCVGSLIRLLQISHKFALVFAVYLLENEILVLSRGGAFSPYFKASPWDFHERPAPLLGICSFSPKKTNAGERMGTLGIE